MIPEINFKEKYPGVTIYENMGIQDEFTLRLEVFVPKWATVEDPKKMAAEAAYYLHYFSGMIVGTEQKENGTLYLVDAWKD